MLMVLKVMTVFVIGVLVGVDDLAHHEDAGADAADDGGVI